MVHDILAQALAARDLDDDERAEVAADLADRIELIGEQTQIHDECRKLVAHLTTTEADALFRYLTHPGVDATNWRAEDAIRPAVANHKVWGGSNHTWRGAATQGRVISVLRPAQQHGIDAIAYLAVLARAPTRSPHPTAALTPREHTLTFEQTGAPAIQVPVEKLQPLDNDGYLVGAHTGFPW